MVKLQVELMALRRRQMITGEDIQETSSESVNLKKDLSIYSLQMILISKGEKK